MSLTTSNMMIGPGGLYPPTTDPIFLDTSPAFPIPSKQFRVYNIANGFILEFDNSFWHCADLEGLTNRLTVLMLETELAR